MSSDDERSDALDIAIVGMAGRFPKAKDLDAFWRNLREGIEGISFFDEAELTAMGVRPEVIRDRRFVKAAPVLDDVDRFDASFFGFSPKDAAIMDPQHRVFLECAHHALEHAGYDPATHPGPIAVYAGTSLSTYLLFNLLPSPAFEDLEDSFQLMLGNDKDFLSTRVSYKLGLRGPSVDVQTGCSTSLVAVHLACQTLLSYQCDMALAGGVSVHLPQRTGYFHEEGGIVSPDGHCRAFSAEGQGTIFGSGAGVVVLKRLEDALADGDTVHAVIKGSAINNDGSLKIGYTAPSIEGQAEVVARAHAVAEVDAATITYVEAHGTGTVVGDPIEVAALTRAFRATTQETQFCALGSVKSSIGHLDAAAGIAGLLKTSLSLRHREIPPSLHCEPLNPRIDFESSPFYVNAELRAWEAGATPRRAGVSSFGIGGTNAHVILEEPPPAMASMEATPWQLLLLSARTPSALERMTEELAMHLEREPAVNLADVAYTLQVGRQGHTHRRVLVCKDREDAIGVLKGADAARVFTAFQPSGSRPIAFLFPGQGTQYPRMAQGLYEQEPLFRRHVDRCAEILRPELGLDLRRLLYPAPGGEEHARRALDRTELTQPALFVIEYALACFWMDLGVRPEALIGHSIGEYVAACLSGVLSLEDALSLVVVRGRWIQQLPPGAMLSVALPEAQVRALLGARLSLAAVNGPSLCVVAGTSEDVERLERQLAEAGTETRRIHTSHAFHSAAMDVLVERFTERVRQTTLHAPRIPYVSNVSGTWITEGEATDPRYWAHHLRQTVRFGDGAATLLKLQDAILLEVGPGRTLGTLIRQQLAASASQVVVGSLRHPQDGVPDRAFLLSTLGSLWLAGVSPSWHVLQEGTQRRRIPLPTYPFERQRYWIDPQGPLGEAGKGRASTRAASTRQLWIPFWKPAVRATRAGEVAAGRGAEDGTESATGRWLVFLDEGGWAERIAARLRHLGHEVVCVIAGAAFCQVDAHTFRIDPHDPGGYELLVDALQAAGALPSGILHAWSIDPEDVVGTCPRGVVDGASWVVRALGPRCAPQPLRVVVVSRGAQSVTGEEALVPAWAALQGLGDVVPREHPNVTWQNVDVALPASGSWQAEQLVEELLRDCLGPDEAGFLAYRGGRRWTRDVEPVVGERTASRGATLREGSVYVVVGGASAPGLACAEHLARTVRARLSVLVPAGFPERGAWDGWLAAHGEAEPVSRCVQRLMALEGTASELLVLGVEVEDATALSAALCRVEAHFGALHGVVCVPGAASDVAGQGAVQEAPEGVWGHVARMGRGIDALACALGERRLDVCLVGASEASVPGDVGLAARAAASGYLEAFAHVQARRGAAWWVSVDEEPGQVLAEALEHVLTLRGTPRVVVSTEDLRENGAVSVRSPRLQFVGTPVEGSGEGAALQHPRPSVRTAYVAPRDERERMLAGIWQALLGIQEVGVHDDFFELGGHSLLATQLASRMRDAFQVEVVLGSLFDTPTVAGLSGVVARLQAEPAVEGAARHARIPVLSREGDAFQLSFAQQRLWFLDQFEPGIAAYHISESVRLRGPLDLAAFRGSLSEVVCRHESLRTTFAVVGGEPVQVVAEVLTLEVPLTDLGELSEAAREATVRERVVDEANRPFDLASGPLLRAHLFRLAPEEHVLLLTVHHIVADGWSMGVLIQEMVALYEAACASRPAPLSPAKVQYVDFSAWQRTWLQGERLDAQLDHWKRALAGSSGVLDLPTDRVRPAVRTYRGARHFFALPTSMVRGLGALSQREGVTLFMTLLAAYQILLHRYARQDDVLVGSPIAGRSRTEIEGLIGFFVNTLVLRGDLSGDPTVRTLLSRVREVAQGAYAHQDLPFEMLVEALRPERDLSRTPLFQVMFALQSTLLPEREVAGLRLHREALDTRSAKFDLLLELYEGKEQLSGWLEYNADLFEAATIARIVEHYQAILEGFVARPEQRISELELVTAAERRQIVEAWNATAVAYPSASLHGLVEAQAARTPEAEAVVFETQRLTYRALDQRANQLARHLHALGVTRETRVGVHMERSVEMVVALLGILKAGGAYVPLDPEYPAERLAFMLDDARIAVLLTQTSLQGALPVNDTAVIALDTAWASVAERSAEPLQDETLPDQSAYVIYTSGSTGRPKGVVNTHRGICNRLQWMQEAYGLTVDDRVLQKTPFGFDVSVWEFFWPLLSGACLVVARPGGHRDSGYLVQVIAEERITTVHFVPSMLQIFLEEDDLAPCRSLARIVCSGEALPVTLAERCLSRLQVDLHNLYGPTEAAVDVSAWACAAGETRRVPIGRPIANIQLYVLDRSGRLCPVGVPGELHIGGVGLARGYLGRPGLTGDRFVPDAFSDEPGARLYRTGDLVRLLPDGALDFLDRIDFQIKLRGFRIELGEIEAALQAHPGVREAVVVVRRDEAGLQALVAYLVQSGAVAPALGDLRASLRARLPEYMIPAGLVFLERMPLNASGKIDRRALPAPALGRRVSEASYAPPSTALERQVATIWQEVLELDRVGLHDNFFDLGGHSLRMVQVRSRLQEVLPKPVSIVELFQYPTIAALLAYLDERHDQRAVVQQSQSRAEARRESLGQLARGRQRPRTARKA
ncbi:hybrid non-ribosomal peptide synthetase/type I polyketide synthase [Chondromyces crocatus]|uniref:Polyketide synthase n=1 Tax=Chondromyces crocatus TaxID=52 RepID=A0A0K1EKR5_CHOCO|nr:hybrid non-ribosomal peptide synthetase/type I polyketide synthase [Chondromyces crocatus]AKT41198.1 uncharacterized protein CMC5_053590 [Chondromyces crocatus]